MSQSVTACTPQCNALLTRFHTGHAQGLLRDLVRSPSTLLRDLAEVCMTHFLCQQRLTQLFGPLLLEKSLLFSNPRRHRSLFLNSCALCQCYNGHSTCWKFCPVPFPTFALHHSLIFKLCALRQFLGGFTCWATFLAENNCRRRLALNCTT